MFNLKNILRAFEIGERVSINQQSHPFERNYLFILYKKNGEKLFLKSWTKELKDNLNNEISVTLSLRKLGYTNVTQYISTHQDNYYFEDKNLIWTLSTFIDGTCLNEVKENLEKEIGFILHNLHIHLEQVCMIESDSILSKIDELNKFIENHDDFIINIEQKRKVQKFLTDNILPIQSFFKEFKKTHIHGDLNFGNIIFNNQFHIIDFEFSRKDYLILEFISLYAPRRNKQGDFIYVGRSLAQNVILHYNNLTGEHLKLTSLEIKYLDEIAVAYYLIIAMETYNNNSIYFRKFINVAVKIVDNSIY